MNRTITIKGVGGYGDRTGRYHVSDSAVFVWEIR